MTTQELLSKPIRNKCLFTHHAPIHGPGIIKDSVKFKRFLKITRGVSGNKGVGQQALNRRQQSQVTHGAIGPHGLPQNNAKCREKQQHIHLDRQGDAK